MCTVSNVMDDFLGRWPRRPLTEPQTQIFWPPGVTREEFDALKKEFAELKEALKKAKLYDEATGQKDCASEDKIAKLKALCEVAGLDISEIVGLLEKKEAGDGH